MQHEPLSDADSATVANQAQEKSLADSPWSFDDYPHLTDGQYDLYDRMREISEDVYCAGWMVDNEFNIWLTLATGRAAFGYRYANPRLLRRCKKLADDIGGWIVWASNGPQFVPMAQWLTLFEAWQAKNAAVYNSPEPMPDPTPAVTSLPPAGLPPCPSS